MKHLFSRLAAIVLVATTAVAVLTVSGYLDRVQAQAAPVSGATPIIPKVAYDSGVVASGAVINSPIFYSLTSTQCEIFADNSAGGSTRTLTVSWYDKTSTTVLETQTVSLTTGTRGAMNVSAYASAATQPTLMLTVPHSPGWYMKASLSSAGAANGNLQVICR